MTAKTAPQLLLDDWAAKSAAAPKPSPAAATPNALGKGLRKRGPRPNPNANKYHELYAMWKGMRNRCLNPSGQDYALYGGRGIRICERWNNFRVFVEDMGLRPSKKHSIDRVDGNGDYCPSNCKWATQFEQMQHSSRNRFLTVNGKSKTLAQWARDAGIPRERIRDRLRRGWSADRAVEVKL
jgi:hypothetical protein